MKSISLFFLLSLGILFIPLSSSAQIIINPAESKVKKFSQEVATQLMKQVCPNTGRDSYATTGTWIYDPSESTFEIPMTAYWSGSTWIMGDTRSFFIQGVLRVNADGTNPKFTTINKSSSVDAANGNNSWAIGAIVGLVALSAAGSN